MLTVAEVSGELRYVPVVDLSQGKPSRQRVAELQKLAREFDAITRAGNVVMLPGTTSFYLSGGAQSGVGENEAMTVVRDC